MVMDLTDILVRESGPGRTAALVEWIQSLYQATEERPVLVGGSAVELYTGGAYVTGDLDFVGSVPTSVAAALRKNGFRKQGRHWIHEAGRVFLEFPSSNLAEGERTVERKFEGRDILIISPEDLVVDRLSAWVHWRSPVDGVNAYLLYRSLAGELDTDRLKARMMEAEVGSAYEVLVSLYNKSSGSIPDQEVLEEWARRIP
jgi:hypothetical protein